MWEIFKTVLYLSVTGSFLTGVLAALKPITSRHISAGWLYRIWLAAAGCMLVPLWKLVPEQGAASISRQLTEQRAEVTAVPVVSAPDAPSISYSSVSFSQSGHVGWDIHEIISYIWLFGAAIFLTAAAVSYVLFLSKKRRGSIELENCSALDEIKRELNIKRRIRVRLSRDSDSPMLVGAFFPVIYVPSAATDENALRMIFRHELTHYRRGDLLYKWLTLIVNAVHWFNPFAYILSYNVNQSCETACDMSVIKSMNESERRLYMKTILDTIESGERL